MSRLPLIGAIAGIISVGIAVYTFSKFSYNFTYLFDFLVVGIFLMLAPAGIVDIRNMRRTRAIEERLPDFIRDVAEASKFGSNLADSIVIASEGLYGILGEEIRRVAAQIKWGVPVDEALRGMVDRNRSQFVEKLMATVIESNRSGGNMSEVLNLIAQNSKEAQNLTREKYTQMRSYVIVLIMAYSVFLLTVLILDIRFFPEMSKQLISNSSVSSFTYLSTGSIPTVKEILTGVVIVQGVGSGLMSGVLGDGRYQSGFLYSAILSSLGYLMILFLGGI